MKSNLTRLIHDITTSCKNGSVDYWTVEWCVAADAEIKKLIEERDKYKQALVSIVHATMVVYPDDGGNHENAYSLAVEALDID